MVPIEVYGWPGPGYGDGAQYRGRMGMVWGWYDVSERGEIGMGDDVMISNYR